MEIALWFVAGYVTRGVIAALFKMGVGVTVVKMAEIRALELLARAEEHYYQSHGMRDIAAETASEKESIKVTKNLITSQHREWQDETVGMLREGMASYKTFVEWETWGEAMQYLTEVKKNERLSRLLTVKDRKE